MQTGPNLKQSDGTILQKPHALTRTWTWEFKLGSPPHVPDHMIWDPIISREPGPGSKLGSPSSRDHMSRPLNH